MLFGAYRRQCLTYDFFLFFQLRHSVYIKCKAVRIGVALFAKQGCRACPEAEIIFAFPVGKIMAACLSFFCKIRDFILVVTVIRKPQTRRIVHLTFCIFIGQCRIPV